MLPMYIAQYYDGYHNMMDGGSWGWGVFMMALWLLIILLLVFFVVRSSGHWHSGSSVSHDEALSIAKKRYDKGEINKEEFDRLKKDLASK